jgi:hypothetical protein
VGRVSSEYPAAERARWLAELAHALDEARLLVKQLGAAEGKIDAVELYARIETLRLEVEMMRLRKSTKTGGNSDPKWINTVPWRLSA